MLEERIPAFPFLAATCGEGEPADMSLNIGSFSTGPLEKALQVASEGGHETIVRLLIDKGAEVNAAPVSICGRRALQAAWGVDMRLLKLLIDNGAE